MLTGLIAVIVSVMGIGVWQSNIVNAEFVETQLNLSIASVLALSVDSCNTSDPNGQTNIYITPNAGGTSQSNQCQAVGITTNASGGYELSIETSSSTLNHNPTLNPQATIPSVAATGALTSDSWGLAIPKSQTNSANLTSYAYIFSSSYTIETNVPSSSQIYTTPPTTSTKFAETDTYSGGTDDYTLYFAANVPATKPSGVYHTTITYTGTALEAPEPPTYCGTQDFECIIYTVDMSLADTPGVHVIGVQGGVADVWDHAYDWDIFVDNQPVTDCGGSNRCIGTGGWGGETTISVPNGIHQIKILPHNGPEPGWGNAFGFYYSGGYQEVISTDAPLTTMAFAPRPSESTTNASWMFVGVFGGCENLATSAQLIDTYKLPNTIENLSNFLESIHQDNVALTTPVDLSGLDSWLNANNSITNLEMFLRYAHRRNTSLTSPINLSPLSGWFSNNNSITHTFCFMCSAHHDNTTLSSPIDLSPVSDWFSNNTSITSLECFLCGVHNNNALLTDPINLTSLSNWFGSNRSFVILYDFMASAHFNNPNLILSGQTIFPDWLKTATENGTPIWNTRAFSGTFYLPTAQGGDTGEPKFQDGTVLSSIGQPNTNNQTYTNRTGVTPVNTNWK